MNIKSQRIFLWVLFCIERCKLQFIDQPGGEAAYLLPGRRWIEFASYGKFKTDVELGQDGMLHRKV